MVGAAIQQGFDRAANPERVERLDQVPFGPRAPSEEDVRSTIQEHQNRYMGLTAARVLELEVKADREPPHVLHLAVGDHKVRWVHLDRRAHGRAVAQLLDEVLPVVDHRCEVVEDARRIADQENLRHALTLACRQQVRHEQLEAGEVMDILVELRDLDDGGRRHAPGERVDELTLGVRQGRQLLQVRPQRAIGGR